MPAASLDAITGSQVETGMHQPPQHANDFSSEHGQLADNGMDAAGRLLVSTHLTPMDQPNPPAAAQDLPDPDWLQQLLQKSAPASSAQEHLQSHLPSVDPGSNIAAPVAAELAPAADCGVHAGAAEVAVNHLAAEDAESGVKSPRSTSAPSHEAASAAAAAAVAVPASEARKAAAKEGLPEVEHASGASAVVVQSFAAAGDAVAEADEAAAEISAQGTMQSEQDASQVVSELAVAATEAEDHVRQTHAGRDKGKKEKRRAKAAKAAAAHATAASADDYAAKEALDAADAAPDPMGHSCEAGSAAGSLQETQQASSASLMEGRDGAATAETCTPQLESLRSAERNNAGDGDDPSATDAGPKSAPEEVAGSSSKSKKKKKVSRKDHLAGCWPCFGFPC